MSFVSTKHASGMVGLVLVAVAARMIFGAIEAGGFDNYIYPAGKVDKAVMAELGKFPGNEVLLTQLERDFPDEHDDFAETVGAAARGSGADDRVLVAANAWMNRFLAAHARDFAAAPLPALDAVISAEQAYLEGLQAYDSFVCGAVVTGAPLDRPLTAALEEKAGAVVARKFAAIKAGRVDQQLRLALTPLDREAMNTALRERGLVEEQIKVLAGEADPSSISQPMACELAVTFNDAVRAQPDGRRALLIGSRLAGS